MRGRFGRVRIDCHLGSTGIAEVKLFHYITTGSNHTLKARSNTASPRNDYSILTACAYNEHGTNSLLFSAKVTLLAEFFKTTD